MEIACFASGAFMGTAQILLGRKLINIKDKPGLSALYIFLLLILSLALLVVVYFVYKNGLLYTAAGLIITLFVLAIINNLKR